MIHYSQLTNVLESDTEHLVVRCTSGMEELEQRLYDFTDHAGVFPLLFDCVSDGRVVGFIFVLKKKNPLIRVYISV